MMDVPRLLKKVYGDDGFYSFEPSATELCITICDMLDISLPWDGGPDPTGSWGRPSPLVWNGVEIVHAEPANDGWCEKCVAPALRATMH